jgi:hypothetical protein
MPQTTQLVITEESKPGTLARVASVLGAANVNIKAFSAPEVKGHGHLRIVVNDLEGARSALKAGKIKFKEEAALVLSLHNEPGALSAVAALLKQAKINITCAYLTPSREGKRAIVVMTVSNIQKALDVLRGESLDNL